MSGVEEFKARTKALFNIAGKDAEKLYNSGFNTVAKLKDADLVDLVPVLGFRGARLVRQKIANALRSKRKEVETVIAEEASAVDSGKTEQKAAKFSNKLPLSSLKSAVARAFSGRKKRTSGGEEK